MRSETKKPIIGITSSYNEGRYCLFTTYSSAISSQGGIPLIIPFTSDADTVEQIVDICDGILLSGGADIDPKFYGEEIYNDTVVVGKFRDEFELLTFSLARRKNKPIMAICRGMQLINVALGGSLYQDLPSQYESDIIHAQPAPKTEPWHSVNTVKDTPLYRLAKSEVMTANSFHHQAVKRLGDGLVPMAYADDGIVEAMYCEGDEYVRAYQWHPERLYTIDENNRLIFRDFINASSGKSYEK